MWVLISVPDFLAPKTIEPGQLIYLTLRQFLIRDFPLKDCKWVIAIGRLATEQILYLSGNKN